MNFNHTIEELMRDLEEHIANDSDDDRKRRAEAGQFHYIPYRMEDFLQQLHAALQLSRGIQSPKFIDAGCGIGTKVLAAMQLQCGLEGHGVEIEPKYVKAARRLLGRHYNDGWQIHQADAIKWDYGIYDVVYFYRPLSDDRQEKQLEARIMSTMKKGALAIVHGNQGMWEKDKHFSRTFGDLIYKKVRA